MRISKPAAAGSLESSDALVTIAPHDGGIALEVESVVLKQFGAEIERAVREALDALHVTSARVHIKDRGAVECVLKARVEAAVKRAGEVGAP